MTTRFRLPVVFLSAVALAIALPASAHGPSGKKSAGPHGGRIIDNLTPQAEFFVTGDRTVQITFFEGDKRIVPPTDQTVLVTAGDRSAPTRLTFTRKGDSLVSDRALPPGNGLPTVVQIKPVPGARTVTEKFNLDLGICAECKLGEYACICDEHTH